MTLIRKKSWLIARKVRSYTIKMQMNIANLYTGFDPPTPEV